MNPETLEPLLLDRALGELSPPVAALLEEHLARDPAAAQHAAGLAETMQLARRATASPTQSQALRPAADLPWFRRAARQARWRGHLVGLAKLAACLVLGLVLGRALGPESSSSAQSRPAALVAAPVTVAAPGSHPKFWSLARHVPDQRAAVSRTGPAERNDQMLWASPFKMPRVEEKP
jgi:anti-sigma factor RsiW